MADALKTGESLASVLPVFTPGKITVDQWASTYVAQFDRMKFGINEDHLRIQAALKRVTNPIRDRIIAESGRPGSRILDSWNDFVNEIRQHSHEVSKVQLSRLREEFYGIQRGSNETILKFNERFFDLLTKLAVLDPQNDPTLKNKGAEVCSRYLYALNNPALKLQLSANQSLQDWQTLKAYMSDYASEELNSSSKPQDQNSNQKHLIPPLPNAEESNFGRQKNQRGRGGGRGRGKFYNSNNQNNSPQRINIPQSQQYQQNPQNQNRGRGKWQRGGRGRGGFDKGNKWVNKKGDRANYNENTSDQEADGSECQSEDAQHAHIYDFQDCENFDADYAKGNMPYSKHARVGIHAYKSHFEDKVPRGMKDSGATCMIFYMGFVRKHQLIEKGLAYIEDLKSNLSLHTVKGQMTIKKKLIFTAIFETIDKRGKIKEFKMGASGLLIEDEKNDSEFLIPNTFFKRLGAIHDWKTDAMMIETPEGPQYLKWEYQNGLYFIPVKFGTPVSREELKIITSKPPPFRKPKKVAHSHSTSIYQSKIEVKNSFAPLDEDNRNGKQSGNG